MQIPVQITFRHMDKSEWIEEMIFEKAEKLNQFAEQLMSCRVVVQPAGKHHRHGTLYEIHIDITLPGKEIVVSRQPSQHSEHQVLAVAISNAFDSARRQLEDYLRKIRHEVKVHESLPHARVTEMNPIDGYGFLETIDGRKIYYHRNSVLNDCFDALDIGTEVVFREEQGEKGPQASFVRQIAKHAHEHSQGD